MRSPFGALDNYIASKYIQCNYRAFEEFVVLAVFFDLWVLNFGFRFPNSRIPVPDSGSTIRFPSLRVAPGLPVKLD